MVNNKLRLLVFLLSNTLLISFIGVSVLFAEDLTAPIDENKNSYSFIVAGHTYGAHYGFNKGLYPKFFNHIRKAKEKNIDFIILTGDIVRSSVDESWRKAEKELREVNLPYYYVMGNHDDSEYARYLFKNKYGDTFYSFDIGNKRFIILDSQKEPRSISNDQLEYLKNQFKENSNIDIVFIFFHELLWNGNNVRYKKILSNYGSRYESISKSNYWSDVHPILVNEKFANKKVYIFSGDTGARPDTIPAFYEKNENITFIASGMGEIIEENYIVVTVDNDNVSFRLVPLNKNINLDPLESYTVENLSRSNFKSLFRRYRNKVIGVIKGIYYRYFL